MTAEQIKELVDLVEKRRAVRDDLGGQADGLLAQLREVKVAFEAADQEFSFLRQELEGAVVKFGAGSD